MRLGNAVRELLRCLGTDGDSTIPWEQVRRWPEGAIDTFQDAGWLKAADLAETGDHAVAGETLLIQAKSRQIVRCQGTELLK